MGFNMKLHQYIIRNVNLRTKEKEYYSNICLEAKLKGKVTQYQAGNDAVFNIDAILAIFKFSYCFKKNPKL